MSAERPRDPGDGTLMVVSFAVWAVLVVMGSCGAGVVVGWWLRSAMGG